MPDVKIGTATFAVQPLNVDKVLRVRDVLVGVYDELQGAMRDAQAWAKSEEASRADPVDPREVGAMVARRVATRAPEQIIRACAIVTLTNRDLMDADTDGRVGELVDDRVKLIRFDATPSQVASLAALVVDLALSELESEEAGKVMALLSRANQESAEGSGTSGRGGSTTSAPPTGGAGPTRSTGRRGAKRAASHA